MSTQRAENPAEHIGLVKTLARRHFRAFRSPVYDRDDLAQEGLEAACRAMRTHDPAQGKFTTYIASAAMRAMRYVVTRECSAGRVPHHAADALGLHPDVQEGGSHTMQERTALNVKRFRQVWRTSSTVDTCRDTPACAGTYGDVDDAIFGRALWAEVDCALSGHPRLRFIIRKRFIEGWTLHDVGAELGFTRERARQLEKRALEILHEHIARLCAF